MQPLLARSPLSGAPNARDLGGRTTGSGRTVVRGRLYRSGALCALTDRDQSTVRALGLRRVIDLRCGAEVAALGADRLPPATSLVGVPVFDSASTALALLGGPSEPLTGRRVQQLLGGDGGTRLMLRLYQDFVALPALRGAFATAMSQLTDPGAYPVLFHCTAGKDRAGWLTAIVLAALGVTRADIEADYLLTNQCLGSHIQGAVETLCARRGIRDPALLGPLLAADVRYLSAAFTEVDRRYGSFDSFLDDGLGVDSTARRRLREVLLDGAATGTR